VFHINWKSKNESHRHSFIYDMGGGKEPQNTLSCKKYNNHYQQMNNLKNLINKPDK
jgi:hypothetical protein